MFNLRRLTDVALSKFQQEPYTFDERYKNVKYERCMYTQSDFKFDKSEKPTVDDYPQGYPQLAAYLNLDPNFPVYRRFGTMRHRVMLHRQIELMKLEQKLNEMDKADWNDHRYRIQSIRKDHENATKEGKERSEREELLNEIEAKLQHYGNTSNFNYQYLSHSI